MLGLLWFSILLHWVWLRGRPATRLTTLTPASSSKKRSKEPTPFAGLLHKPLCDACAQAAASRPPAPYAPPPVLTFTRGRRRTIETRQQFCPADDCAYYGWVGRGNIRANGHPGGKPWRQFQCVACQGYFQETHGTPLHGKRVSSDMLVWAVGALDLLYLLLLTPIASRNCLLYQSLPTSIQHRYGNFRRRKDDTGLGAAARRITE